MSAPPIPPRPRLAAHVLARRHVIDGQERVLLHDQERDDVLQIGPREWGVLTVADGTRDVEGIVVAARREGAFARVEAVRGLLATLAARGMIEAGDPAEVSMPRHGSESVTASRPASVSSRGDQVPRVAGESPVAPDPSEASVRPLVPQPGGGLRCDGSGTCCRLYGTVMMSPQELRRAQVLLPRWRVGAVPPERWATPLRGSEPGPVLAAVARDGACGFLRDDGLCAIHLVGGAEAKPWGCQAFPRLYVDDGAAVHVVLKPECPCVLAPVGDEEEPLVDPAWDDARDLPPAVVVDALPEVVALGEGHRAERAAVRRWVAGLAARAVPGDPAAAAWALADRVQARGLCEPDDTTWAATPPAVEAVMPWLRALHRRAAARAREHAAWRSEDDLVRQVTTALALLSRLLLEPAALAEAMAQPPEHPDQEARFWRGGLHAYRWFRDDPLVTTLRDDALRLWLARSLPATLGDTGLPDHRAPLALVEAMMRAHGVGAYVDDVTQNE